MVDNIFQKIIKKEAPAEIVYEDSLILVFKDINPAAKVHLLAIPKRDITNLAASSHGDDTLMGHMLSTIREIMKELKVADYRVVINNGTGAGQTVDHLHMHVLAGRDFKWPPG